MGRTQPSQGAPPPSQRRDARAKKAKQTLNKDIPALLRAYPQVQAGIDSSELYVDPQRPEDDDRGNATRLPPTVRVYWGDTLDVAAVVRGRANRGKSKNVAILNMASPLRPGGGFLNGATSQEESLCMRTTLLPSLKDEFYRLPEIGGILTANVLVFRSNNVDLPKSERFMVDVVTSAMHRMPDVEEDETGQRHYANSKDQVVAEAKVRAVMRIAQTRGVRKLVLGAWGCGAYGNPVNDILNAFHTVLRPELHSAVNGTTSREPSEVWNGMECIFAITDRHMAQQFAEKFRTEVEVVADTENDESNEQDTQTESASKIEQLEHQIASARSELLKGRLQETLEKIRQLEQP